MKHACKRIVALLLAAVMIIGILPLAMAANVGPFTDVQEDDWYAEYVAYVYEYGLMNGMTKTTFEPNGTCTRAMAATVLYRIAGEPTVAEPATFTDLTADWYLDSVAWAEDEGVVNGVGDGKFNPDGLVTREQLVTMIWRFAGEPEPVVDGGIDSYPDAASVSDYAVKAFNWAISKGIINGKDGNLVPAGNATRAEFAKIITVYDQSNEPCEEHTWVEGDVITEPTCTEDGAQEYICSVCGEKKTEAIPALGHNYVDGVCSACGDKLAEEDEVVIYYTNDVHTYIDKALSYDNIADLKSQTEKVAADVLLLDAGDHAQGTAFGGMDKGQTIIELMNAAGYDYATLGNHEFDYGMDGAMNFIKWADFTYLSANFYEEADGVRGENVLDSYAIVELAGKKVAIIGITTPESFTKSTPAYFQDENGNYIYGISGGEDGSALYADVQAAIDAAKAEGAEIVIALAHLGDDPASDPWNSEDVIENTTGLDALIDGHSHSTVEGKEVADKDGNPVLLTQTGEYFNAIGKMTIDAEGKISTELITSYTGSDASVAADVDAWIAEVDELLGTVVAKSEVDFIISDDTGRLIRKQETNLGDFAADALYYLFDNMDMDVDVAIMNGGGIRADMPAGDISYKTTKTVHTFGNVACLQTITGQQLLDALEWGAKNVGVGENGGFLQVSGITYEIHSYIPSTVQADDKGVWAGAPTGEYRVKNVMVGGEPLDLTAKYNLAGYNYTLRDLGDGFAMFDGAVNVLDYVMEDYLVLANYAQSFPEATIKADNSVLGANYGDKYGEGRITIVTEKEDEDDGAFVLTSELKDGDKVVIYNAGSGMAFSSVPTGYYVAGVSVTPADNKIATEDATIIWDVKKNDDGTYTFTQGANVLMVGIDGTYSNVYFEGDYADTWNLTVCNAANSSYYISSATETTSYGNVYLEWYAAKTAFSAYSTGNISEGAFGFQFYAIGGDGGGNGGETGESAVYEKVTSDLGSWEGTYVIGWDDGTNANIFDGQNDADKNNVAVALNNNTVTVSNDCAIVITAVDGGYTLKAKGGYLNGALDDQGAMKNDLVFETEPAVATITWENGNPIITSAVGTIFRFNNASYDGAAPYSWFRFFKPTSSVQTPVSLYKLTDETPVVCEHMWNEGEVTTEPTCTAKGEKTYTCGLCGATKTEEIAALGHNYVDGTCTNCGDAEPTGDEYVAIFNNAKGKVMTSETSTYTNSYGTTKIQMVSADATLNAEGKLETTATNVATFKMETNVDGITSFITEDGKFLFCDGTNMGIADEGGDYTEFVLEETEGGYFIKCANAVFTNSSTGTTSAQYIEFYANVFTVYGMGSDASIYTFNFYELAETEVPPAECEHVWDNGVTTDPTCTADGKTVFTCTLCGETNEEAIAALGHDFVDGICSVCGAEEAVDPDEGAFVLATELADGDEVIIYHPASGNALSSEIVSTYYKAGVAVTPTDGKIDTTDSSIIWTVAADGTGFNLINANGEKLSIDGTYNSIPYDKGNDAWTVAAATTSDCVYVVNENGKYLDWSSYGNFSAYNYDATKEADYAMQLYVKAAGPACEHVWDEGEVTTEPDCTNEGEMTFNCTVCDETKTEAIAALGHTDADMNEECDNCGTLLGGDLTEVAYADLADGDTIMIVMHTAADMTNKDFVLLNNFGTAAANSAAEFDGTTHDTTMYWTVSIVDGEMKFYANGTSDYLYSTNANNGMRVGQEDAGAIGYDAEMGYLTIVDLGGNVRYLGVYDNNGGDTASVPTPNFRAYKLKDDGTLSNIGGQTLTIYKIG